MNSMKTLLLVDASSYLYRAFHALPDLRNKRGEPTGAIYGVINMLRRLHKEVAADYSACVFDAKGKTFRDDWYPQYKANRPPMPDDMRAQIGPLHECVRALGWPMLEITGVEADDVIGTLAVLAKNKGIRCLISSGDKDLTQLVDPLVTMVNTMSNETFDEAGVEAKFGVKPAQIIDYLTLIGDSVDNVPGVEKVGPKTAVKWLTQYGSLDNVIAHESEISGVVGENLRKARDWLPKARQLLTVKCDVELPMVLESLHYGGPDIPALRELFDRLEFKSWRRELDGGEAPREALGSREALGVRREASGEAVVVPAREVVPRHYECVLASDQFEAWVKRIEAAELVSVDTETTSLDPMQARIVGISLSVAPHEGAYIPLAHRYPGAPDQLGLDETLARLKPWLEDASRAKVGQNAKYDSHVFANHGIALRGVVHDTLLQSYVLESHKPHDMDSMAARHLGVKTILYAEVAGKGANHIGFDQVSVEKATEYSAEDSDVTLQLHQLLYPQLQAEENLLYIYEKIEMPAMEVLLRMERNGVLLDAPLLDAQ
ncbi:MAG: 5'-3' exonuclease H3TH domain-containing protein, partial [Burkholderiales bacterium]